MPEETFYSAWQLGYVLGAVVVLAVATLLIAILLVARKIESLASAALGIAGQIESRTGSIWLLGEANRITARILARAHEIEQSTRVIADALDPAGKAS